MFVGILCMIYSVVGNQKIEIGETVNNAITPWHGNSQYQLYQFELKELKQDSDLLVIVKQQSALGNPDIYISSSKTEPNEHTADKVCDSIGMDICIIENPRKGFYYLAVHCEGFCRYSLKVVYQSELLMTNSDDLEFKLDKQSWADIVRIEANTFNWEEAQNKPTLEIQVRVKNIEILQETFRTYLNFGLSTPTPEKSDYIGQDTFSGMQKFKIRNLEQFNNFTLLVEGQEGAIFQIQTRTYGTTRQLQLGEKVEDIVMEDDYQFYCINIAQDSEQILLGQEILNIQLLPFKGYTEMFVNLDTQPLFVDQYKWQIKDRLTDDLVITKADLQSKSSKVKYIYIAIKGVQSNATYELNSQVVDSKFMILKLNQPTTSKLLQNSFIQYKFYIRSAQKQTVSVSLKNIIGDSDIILKQCQNFFKCILQQEDIPTKKEQQNTQIGNLFLYSDNAGNDIIVFDNHPEVCQQNDNTYDCYYVIMIYPGKENKEEELTYSVLVTTKGESTILKENTPVKQFVGLGLNNYYKFIVEEQDHIRRMMIQVTPIQGQPKIFASKTNKNPTSEDKQAIQNVIIYGQENSETIDGTFYITVNGYTSCQYIITVYVFRNRGDWNTIGKYPHQYIQLLEGYPQLITYQNNSEVQLFKIDLSAYYNPDQKNHYSVDVKLRVIQGSFKMYGFDHPEINKTNAFLKGTDFLSIGSGSQIYPQYLYIRVEADPMLSTNQLSYQIFYRINNQPIELILSDNYRGYIAKDDTQTFFLNYFKNDELLVTINAENYDQSVLSGIIYIDNEVYAMKSSSFELKKEVLKYEKCKTNATNIIKCQITIMVSSSQDTYFSLLVTKESSIVFLYDGEPVTKTLNNNDDHFLFYLTDQETEISVFSISAEVKIFLQFFNEKPELEDFPNDNQNSAIQSLADSNDIGSSIFISKEFLEANNCINLGCYIAITCQKDPKYESRGDYVITRSSSYQIIYPSLIYFGEAQNTKIKYYKISNVSLYNGLMVIVSPLDSGSLIVLASQNEMPTLDTFQYSSNTMIGDQLMIPPKKDSNEMVNYFIGVYGFEDVKFQIQVSFGNVQFYQIKKAKPFNFYADQDSVTFLNYYHVEDSEFTILFSSSLVTYHNKPKVYVQTYKNMSMQSDAINIILSNKEKMWTMNDNFLRIGKDSQYCNSCYYLICVQNQLYGNDITITVSLDNESTQLLDNVEITNKIQTKSVQYYHYIAQDDFYLNATLFKGKVKIFGGFYKKSEEVEKLLLTLDERDGIFNEKGEYHGQGLFPNKTIEIAKSEKERLIYRFKIVSDFVYDSTYKIECIQKQQAIQLILGEPQTLILNSTHTVPFFFTISKINVNDQNIGLFIIDIETSGHAIGRIIDRTQHPFIKLTQDAYNNPNFLSDYHHYQEVEPIKLNQTDSIIHLEFKLIPGLYFLQISPREISNLPYTVTLGNDVLNVLAPKLSRFSSNKIGQSRYWEVNIYQPSLILIQAQSCGGIMNVYGSDNLESLKQGSYSERIDYKNNAQIIGTIRALQYGPYYLSTQAIKSFIPYKDDLDYIIQVSILSQNTVVPDEKFQPGNGGKFEVLYDGEQIKVLFEPIKYLEQSSSDYVINRFTYYFIYKFQTSEEDIPVYHCDQETPFPSFGFNSQQHKKLKELNYTIYAGNNFEKMSITILAKVRIKTKNYEEIKLKYYYETKSILIEKQTHQMRTIVIGIISVLLLYIVYIFFKNRRLNKILRFESNDQGIQNLVGQEQSIEMNYSSLR